MKIIQRGKIPTEKVYIGECYKCSTIVEALKHEVHFPEFGGIEIKCPLCGNTIDLKEK